MLALASLTGHHGVVVSGFVSSGPQQQSAYSSLSWMTTTTTTRLFAADVPLSSGSPTRSKPMSAEQIKAQMGIQEDEPPPKLFSESLYEDIQQTLLLLEKRIAQGPGSLSLLEVEAISAQTHRIAEEMRNFEDQRVNGLGMAHVGVEMPVAPSPGPVGIVPGAEIVQSTERTDISEDEGPAYDGKGGFGLSKGTRNTYVIPGMDEMSPEEYQKALQQSVIDQQSARKRNGTTGNRATWDYLNNLTGQSGVLKSRLDDEQP